MSEAEPKADLRQQRLASYKNIQVLLGGFNKPSKGDSEGPADKGATGSAVGSTRGGLLDLNGSGSNPSSNIVGVGGGTAGRRTLQRTTRHVAQGDPALLQICASEALPFAIDLAAQCLRAKLYSRSLGRLRERIHASAAGANNDSDDPLEKTIWVEANATLSRDAWKDIVRIARKACETAGAHKAEAMSVSLAELTREVERGVSDLAGTLGESNKGSRVVEESYRLPREEIADPKSDTEDSTPVVVAAALSSSPPLSTSPPPAVRTGSEDSFGVPSLQHHSESPLRQTPSGDKALVRSKTAPNQPKFQITRPAVDPAEIVPPGASWFVVPRLGIQVSAASDEGRRSHNEDTFVVLDDHYVSNLAQKAGDKHFHRTTFVGVFDGHSGASCSHYARIAVPWNFFYASAGALEEDRLRAAYEEANAAFNARQETVGQGNIAGTTAATLIIRKKTLLFANVGDTEAILCYGRHDGAPVWSELSCKHTAKAEQDRIEAAGGKVVWFGSWRVNGVLAVSRSIGDPKLGASVIAEPYVARLSRSETKEGMPLLFAILATDGLWDVVSYRQACAIVLDHVYDSTRSGSSGDAKSVNYNGIDEDNFPHKKTANEDESSTLDHRTRSVRSTVARRLVDAAMRLGSNDNTTVAVIFFDGKKE